MSDGGIQYWQTLGQFQFYPGAAAGLTAAHNRTTTMKLGQMIESKYLKQSDVPEPALVTIKGFHRVNVSQPDDAPEYKWTLAFHEYEKPMVLNSTNIQLLGVATGTDDTEQMIGHKVVLYTDPNVSFQGKLVGGLRIRAVRNKNAQRPAPQPAPASAEGFDDMDDDIPF